MRHFSSYSALSLFNRQLLTHINPFNVFSFQRLQLMNRSSFKIEYARLNRMDAIVHVCLQHPHLSAIHIHIHTQTHIYNITPEHSVNASMNAVTLYLEF